MWTGEVPELYRAIRQLNASLSAEHQLRILLGDPPIDWGQVRTKEDHAKWIALRDTFPANLIEREVLAKHRRALVVFGNMHFQRKNLLANYESAGDGVVATVVSALEQAGSKTRVFSLWTATESELSDIQADVAKWDAPSLAMLRGTVLGAADFHEVLPLSDTTIRYPRWERGAGPARSMAFFEDGGPVRRRALSRPRSAITVAAHGL
jgi:hypothetical protein